MAMLVYQRVYPNYFPIPLTWESHELFRDGAGNPRSPITKEGQQGLWRAGGQSVQGAAGGTSQPLGWSSTQLP
jgi:hypothetical protein